MKEIISSATYKTVKKRHRIAMNEWLTDYALACYNDGCLDAALAEILALRDEFDMENDDIARFMKKRDTTISAINQRLITRDELLEGLRNEEGLKIKTDFEPKDVRAVPMIGPDIKEKEYNNEPDQGDSETSG